MFDKTLLISELHFKATRSSGPGGQHVNKTSTRIELQWALDESKVFSEEEKLRIQKKLAHRLTKENKLQLASSLTRSQFKNKQDVIRRFFALLEVAIQVPTTRKKRRISRTAHIKRLQSKKIHSQKKANRKKPEI